MPSLFRFLFTILLIGALGYGTMVGLALFVEPNERDMTIRVPAKRINP